MNKFFESKKTLETEAGIKLIISESPSEIIIDKKSYIECTNCIFTGDLNDLFERDSIESTESYFSNEHRYAAYYVVDGDMVLNETKYPASYRASFERDYPKIKDCLVEDLHSRRAVIHFTGEELPCFISIQFLIRDNFLNVIANFRSWELETWAIYDVYLIRELSRKIYSDLRIELDMNNLGLGNLTLVVASAHVEIS